jgi:hypothetical protein
MNIRFCISVGSLILYLSGAGAVLPRKLFREGAEYYQKALELFEELKDVRNTEIVKKNIESLKSM